MSRWTEAVIDRPGFFKKKNLLQYKVSLIFLISSLGHEAHLSSKAAVPEKSTSESQLLNLIHCLCLPVYTT